MKARASYLRLFLFAFVGSFIVGILAGMSAQATEPPFICESWYSCEPYLSCPQEVAWYKWIYDWSKELGCYNLHREFVHCDCLQ